MFAYACEKYYPIHRECLQSIISGQTNLDDVHTFLLQSWSSQPHLFLLTIPYLTPNLLSYSVLEESTGLLVSRQLLSDFANALETEIGKPRDARTISSEIFKQICYFALEAVQPRVVSFEDQVTVIRRALAQQLEMEENWREAASVLMGIPLETGHRNVSDDMKLRTYLKIAALYLEDSDAVQAEIYVNRASGLVTSTKDPTLELQFKVKIRDIDGLISATRVKKKERKKES